jgi:hypothetical protein
MEAMEELEMDTVVFFNIYSYEFSFDYNFFLGIGNHGGNLS